MQPIQEEDDMSDYQTIHINLGLNWTDGDKSGEFDQELGRFIVETKFPYCGIVSEPYKSTWEDSSGKVYEDKCLAFRIKVSRVHAMPIGEIERRLESVRVILKQDAIAFTTRFCSRDLQSTCEYSDVYYGDTEPEDRLLFDKKYFHYVK